MKLQELVSVGIGDGRLAIVKHKDSAPERLALIVGRDTVYISTATAKQAAQAFREAAEMIERVAE